MLYRVALQGFAESDRRALASFVGRLGGREPGYLLVPRSDEADVILADGDSPEVVANVVDEARIATTLFLSAQPPRGSIRHLARPARPDRLLHGLDDLITRLHDIPSAAQGADDDSRTLTKAVARSAARRRRVAAAAAVSVACPRMPDVLVLDVDDADRDHLCALLEHFGFCAYPARTADQADWLLGERSFRAAFLQVALDGSDQDRGIGLCRRVTRGRRAAPRAESALFVVAGQVCPADRVRAALLGCSAFLSKPLSRGGIAGALEASGVVMPSDDRRG